MDNIKIDYQIPDKKEDITIEQWMKYEALRSQDDMDLHFLQMKMLEIFCNVPFKYAHRLPQKEVSEAIGYVTKVLNEPSELKKTFVFEGVKYGLINDFKNDILTDELIDLDGYLQSKDYDKLLSILYRPIVKETGNLYQIETYSGTHDKFKKLRYDILDGCIAFFLTILDSFVKSIPKFIEKQMKKEGKLNLDSQKKIDSLKNMVLGRNSSTS